MSKKFSLFHSVKKIKINTEECVAFVIYAYMGYVHLKTRYNFVAAVLTHSLFLSHTLSLDTQMLFPGKFGQKPILNTREPKKKNQLTVCVAKFCANALKSACMMSSPPSYMCFVA